MSRLLNLPAELRHSIIALACSGIHVEYNKDGLVRADKIIPTLLRTCSILRLDILEGAVLRNTGNATVSHQEIVYAETSNGPSGDWRLIKGWMSFHSDKCDISFTNYPTIELSLFHPFPQLLCIHLSKSSDGPMADLRPRGAGRLTHDMVDVREQEFYRSVVDSLAYVVPPSCVRLVLKLPQETPLEWMPSIPRAIIVEIDHALVQLSAYILLEMQRKFAGEMGWENLRFRTKGLPLSNSPPEYPYDLTRFFKPSYDPQSIRWQKILERQEDDVDNWAVQYLVPPESKEKL